jgi:hypothetical protein
MLDFVKRYAGNVHSQNGEDLIIQEGWKRITANQHDGYLYNGESKVAVLGHAVEIGGNEGLWLSNTRYLIEQGWSGLFVEADHNLYLQSKQNWADNPHVRHQCSRVDGRNVNAFVDDKCDLLSIDTDGGDYAIFCGMKARPKIVIVEIDSSIEPPSERVNSDGGVGYWTMTVAALERGYFVLCHTGNLILVKQEYGHLFPECEPHPLLEWELYFNRSWLQ